MDNLKVNVVLTDGYKPESSEPLVESNMDLTKLIDANKELELPELNEVKKVKEPEFEDLINKLQISGDEDIVGTDELKEISLSELESDLEPEKETSKNYSFTDYEPNYNEPLVEIDGYEKPIYPIIPKKKAQSGGINLTEHFDKVDNEQYKKTIEYLRNYNSDDYKDYLKEYESFFKEQNTKSNLSKYDYSVTNTKLIKSSLTNPTKNTVIHKPKYGKINDIINEIEENLNNLEYNIVKLRDDLLLDKNVTTNYNELKRDYIKLLNQRMIFKNYRDQILQIKEKNQERELLLERKRVSKLECNKLFIKLNELNRTTKDREEITKTVREYLKQNDILMIEKKLRVNDYKKDLTWNIDDETEINLFDYIILESPKIEKNISLSEVKSPKVKAKEEKEPPKVKAKEEKEPPKVKAKEEKEPPKVKAKEPKKLKIKVVKDEPKKLKIKKPKVEVQGNNSINSTTELKESDIDATNVDNRGKKRSVVGKVQVKDGKCIFPFKNGKKYISESDGCVKGKTGDWCATKVNKDEDYKMESFGYCK